MGFLGFGNYQKEGPGVPKIEPPKKRIQLFFEIYIRRFWDLIKVNLLFLLFCIPIVTIGPALSGMTYVIRNYTREEHSFIFNDFWKAFKNNLKQSFPTGIIQILSLGIFYYVISFYYYNLSLGVVYYIGFGISLFLCLTVLFASNYVYIMIVTLDLNLKAICKNAFIFAFVGLKENLFTLLGTVGIVVILAVIFLFVPIPINLLILFILLVLMVPATLTFISCFNSYPLIKKYCIDPYMQSINGNSGEVDADDDDESKIFDDKVVHKDNNEV